MSYTVTNTFATQSGNVPASQLDTNFTNVLSGVNNAFLVGTLAARPAPDGVGNGRYYFATDVSGGTLYRDNGSAWVAVGPGVNSGTVAIVPNTIINLGITASVSGNNLSISLTDGSGSALTSSNVAYIAFRNATLTTGYPSQVTISSASTLTVASGTTVGTTNGVTYRLYIVACNNAGTVVLGIYNPVSGTSLIGLNEAKLYSPNTPGNSAQTLYAQSALTNVPIRVIGYIEINEATAGTWATAPTVIQVMGPGVPRTMQVMQSIFASYSTQTANATSTYADTGLTATITPNSVCNLIKTTVFQNGIHEQTNAGGVLLKLVAGGSDLALIGSALCGIIAASAENPRQTAGIVYVDAPATTSARIYKTQFAHGANNDGATVQDASAVSTILLEELFA